MSQIWRLQGALAQRAFLLYEQKRSEDPESVPFVIGQAVSSTESSDMLSIRSPCRHETASRFTIQILQP